MFFFSFSNRIDATEEDGHSLGRLINHPTKADGETANLEMKHTDVDGRPAAYLVAKRVIRVGEQVFFDYGERNKEALIAFPFLRV